MKVGDTVSKGQEIGRTGTTGLAIGDHLHYEVLVHGVSVTPLEWWDGKWIRDRVGKPLKEAGLPEIVGAEARDEDPAPARPPDGHTPPRPVDADQSGAHPGDGRVTGGRAPGADPSGPRCARS